MTHLYIKLCDLCGRPCEVDSGLHGGSISSDIMVSDKKISRVVFREDFDVCITCLKKLGLIDLLKRMKEMKDSNTNKKLEFKKLLEEKGVLHK